ncbi:MAG: sigma-70 family RNA polymerase sigma factor [Planctomycetota bacterium]|jgi:RNA polymerase sigma-70 factor (ECF subfamily)
MESSSEQTELLARLRADGERVLADEFSKQRTRLWRMVSFRLDARLRGRVDPEDILQEAFLDAAQRLDHFLSNPVTSLFIWLRLIVMQTMQNVYRRHLSTQKRDASRELSRSRDNFGDTTAASITAFLAGQLTSPSQAAMKQEQMAQLDEALVKLSELDQEVLALRHFEELSNAETAEALGIDPKAASVRYFRALRRLKGVLEKLSAFKQVDSD